MADILKFPVIGADMDKFISRIWDGINELPDDTLASSIIGALEIVKADILDGMKTK